MYNPDSELWKLCTHESYWQITPQNVHFDPKWKNILKIRSLISKGSNPFLIDAKGNYLCNIMFTRCMMYWKNKKRTSDSIVHISSTIDSDYQRKIGMELFKGMKRLAR